MYVPYLSLVYGGLDLAERTALVDALDPPALPDEAVAREVTVVETPGPVPAWERVASVTL